MRTDHAAIILLQIIGFAIVIFLVRGIHPQVKEQYVSLQTVLLDGQIYTCGTVGDNQDFRSLYCRGFSDGYSSAVRQVNFEQSYKSN